MDSTIFQYSFNEIITSKTIAVLQAAIAILLIRVILNRNILSSIKHRMILKERAMLILKKYEPEALVEDIDLQEHIEFPLVTDKQEGKHIVINNNRCLNFGTLNFLGLAKHPKIEMDAVQTIKKYGIGSCGPRGFLGTMDIHLELEENLAQFMGTDQAIVYSYGFSVSASAIPAYSKKGDYIFVDENVNFAIQKGLHASNSTINYFKHNDVAHLEQLLQEFNTLEKKGITNSKTRKFLVVEGIYTKTGDLAPLPKLMEIKNKHKLRIFIDETISFGTIGKTGRGITEYFKINIKDVDLIIASLETCLASVGGFCVGSSFILEHHHATGIGYGFSASLPPVLARTAISALQLIKENSAMVKFLNANSKILHDLLLKNESINKYFSLISDICSPIKILIARNSKYFNQFHSIQNQLVEYNIIINVPAYLKEDYQSFCSLRVSANPFFTKEELENTVSILATVISVVVNE